MLKARLHCLAPFVELCSHARVLLAAQASLIALPDELLGSILRRAWADRLPRPAAEEVRAAAGLASVCRRWSELLRAPPLPLALDFSAARLSGAQRGWLLEPAQAGRVEAVSFFWEDAAWEQPLLDDFLTRHGGTLLQLSGVPLRLVAGASQGSRPALDLSGLRLTKLGINGYKIERSLMLALQHVLWPPHVWLWPECLPGTLEELELLGLEGPVLGDLAWAPCVGSGSAGCRLPRLQTLRIREFIYGGGNRCRPQLNIFNVPLMEGLAGPVHFEVDDSSVGIGTDGDLFGRVCSLRIQARSCMQQRDSQVCDVATIVDCLCPAGLQAAELRADAGITLMRLEDGARKVVRELMSRCGEHFAIEVGVAADFNKAYRDKSWQRGHWNSQSVPVVPVWNQDRLQRLAWRRWPAAGAPDLPAARAAHERARAWAAACGQ